MSASAVGTYAEPGVIRKHAGSSQLSFLDARRCRNNGQRLRGLPHACLRHCKNRTSFTYRTVHSQVLWFMDLGHLQK